LHATIENSELKQEVDYLSSRLERIIVSEKIIEEDFSRVEESATKSTYKLGVGFERCGDKGEKSVPKFVPSSDYHKEKESLKSTKIHYPSNPKPSFNPKRGVKKNTPNPSEEVYICMFCGRAGHLDEFCFQRKRMEKRHVDYARNSYHDKFIDFLPHFSSHAPSHFSHGPNHRSYGFDSREGGFFLDPLVSTHALIVVFIPRIGMVFPLEVSIFTLSWVALMVHAFHIVVDVPLAQMVRYKGL
jgi:hypothetical protein